MEDQKHSWTTAHARLWTSFKNTQDDRSSLDSKKADRKETSTKARSAYASNPMTVRDITLSILSEVMKRHSQSEPVFPAELETRIAWLVENEDPDSPLRDLLAAVMHLKKVGERDKRPLHLGHDARRILEEALYHLIGRKPASEDEGHRASIEIDDNAEGLLLKVVEQIEKYKNMARKFAERCGVCKSVGGDIPLGSIIEMLCSSKPQTVNGSTTNCENEVLWQVMDILGASSDMPSDQVPTLALKLVKDLELARRENHTNSMLLRQYERSALTKFAACGVVSPPTVDYERDMLLSDNPTVGASSSDQWVEDSFETMVSTMKKVGQYCQLNVVPSCLGTWPTDSSAEVTLDYMRTSLGTAGELMDILVERERSVQLLLLEMTRKLRGCADVAMREISEDVFTGASAHDALANEHCTLFESVQKLGQLVDRKLEKERENELKVLQDSGKRTKEALMRVLRWLPDGDDASPSIHNSVKLPQSELNEEALVSYAETEVRRLASRSSIPDALVPHIRELCSNITQLTDDLRCGGTQAIDESTVTTLLSMVEQLRRWVVGERTDSRSDADNVLLRKCLCELAQLLPTGVSPISCEGTIEIIPPVDNLLEMVQLLRRRQEQWVQEQQKQQLSGAHSRIEKARVEEIVREGSKQLVKLCKEILLISVNSAEAQALISALSDDTNDAATLKEVTTDAAPSNNQVNIGVSTTQTITAIFDDLSERLKLIKTRYHRLQHAYAANKVRLDNLIQSNAPRGKRWVRICNTVGALCRTVGLEDVAQRLEHDGRHGHSQIPATASPPPANTSVTTASSSSAFEQTLRADSSKTDGGQLISDGDLLESLKLIEARLKEDTLLCDRVTQQSVLAKLQDERRQWREEVVTFRQAIQVILYRLAESGRRIKRSLFLLGTDECAEDDVVETIIREQRLREEQEELNKNRTDEGDIIIDSDDQGESDEGQSQKQQEVNEEALAVLLRKFARWATRLQDTTEDHLHSQRKLVKYFAAVHRFFCNVSEKNSQTDTSNDVLLDIDSTLMHFADGILPAIDRAINTAQSFKKRRRSGSGNGGGCKALLSIIKGENDDTGNTGDEPGGGKSGEADDNNSQSDALALLLQNAPGGRILPVDHRVTRLYEMVGKLRTMIGGLLSVHYLAIPVGVGHRGGSGSGEDLVFKDGFDDNSYIELDLDKLKAVSTHGNNGNGADAGGDSASGVPCGGDADSCEREFTALITDEKLLHVVETNMSCVYRALSKFSTDYKLAAILLQKDTESMQQSIANMLKYYVELDVKRSFGQDPEVLRELYNLLNERGKRQRGCYFFSRIGGEGPCVWSVALEQLSCGFVGILEKLQKRTEAVAELRELVDDVVDICAMYVNWVDLSGAALTSMPPLPDEVKTACIRQDDIAGEMEAQADRRVEQQLRSNEEKREYRINDHTDGGATHTPIAEPSKPPFPPGHIRPTVSHFKDDVTVLKVIAHMFQVAQEAVNLSGNNSEETQRLEEQLQLLRESVIVAEQGRDKAMSEAAVSRAELRRWKKRHQIAEENLHPPPPLTSPDYYGRQGQPLQRQKQGKSNVSHPFTSSPPATTFAPTNSEVYSGVENAPSCGNVSYDREDALLHVAEVMKELTEELRGVCHRRAPESPPSPVSIYSEMVGKPMNNTGTRLVARDEADSYSTCAALRHRNITSKSYPFRVAASRGQEPVSQHYTDGRNTLCTGELLATPPHIYHVDTLSVSDRSISPLSYQVVQQGKHPQNYRQHTAQSLRRQRMMAPQQDEARNAPCAAAPPVASGGVSKSTSRVSPARHHSLCIHRIDIDDCDLCSRRRSKSRVKGGGIGGTAVRNMPIASGSATSAIASRTPASPSAAQRAQTTRTSSRTPVRGATPSSLSSTSVQPTSASHVLKRRDVKDSVVEWPPTPQQPHHEYICEPCQRDQRCERSVKTTKRPSIMADSGQRHRYTAEGNGLEETCESPTKSLFVRANLLKKPQVTSSDHHHHSRHHDSDCTMQASSMCNTTSSVMVSSDSTAVFPDAVTADKPQYSQERKRYGLKAIPLHSINLGCEETQTASRRSSSSGRAGRATRANEASKSVLRQQRRSKHQASPVSPHRASSFGVGASARSRTSTTRQPSDIVARTRVGKRDEF